MHTISTSISAIFILLVFSCKTETKTVQKDQPKTKTATEFCSKEYHYCALIPGDWTEGRENDLGEGALYVEWKLPFVYSNKLKQNIGSHIAIESTKTDRPFEELIEESLSAIKLAADDVQWNDEEKSMTMRFKEPGYAVGKAYYLYKNNIVYRLVYVASDDTFEKNIAVFEEFKRNFKID